MENRKHKLKALGPIVLHLSSQDQVAPMRRISKAETYRRQRSEHSSEIGPQRSLPLSHSIPFFQEDPLDNPDKFD